MSFEGDGRPYLPLSKPFTPPEFFPSQNLLKLRHEIIAPSTFNNRPGALDEKEH